eukprot:15099-Heterococcus_DN1.PRE.1
MQRGISLLRGTSGEECRAGRVSGAPPPLTTKAAAAAAAAKQPARHALWHSCCNRGGTLCSSMTLASTMCWELGEQGCQPMSTGGEHHHRRREAHSRRSPRTMQ